MSNITFDSGDYRKELNIGNIDGLIYLNTANRNIAIGRTDDTVDFNTKMINDNQQLPNSYTKTSEYLVDKKVIIDNNSDYYYPVSKAIDKFGTTDNTMIDGYIKRMLNVLINGITYESTFDRSVVSTTYSWFKYHFYYPSIVQNHNFNNLIVFAYRTTPNLTLMPFIYNVESQQDIELVFANTNINADIVYKAFWV